MAGAILALEVMVVPEGYAQLRRNVIDGKLSFDKAVAKVRNQSDKETGRPGSPASMHPTRTHGLG